MATLCDQTLAPAHTPVPPKQPSQISTPWLGLCTGAEVCDGYFGGGRCPEMVGRYPMPDIMIDV